MYRVVLVISWSFVTFVLVRYNSTYRGVHHNDHKLVKKYSFDTPKITLRYQLLLVATIAICALTLVFPSIPCQLHQAVTVENVEIDLVKDLMNIQ